MQQAEQWRIPGRTAALEAARPKVILYAIGPALTAHCLAAAKAAEIGAVEVKHLQAACAALRGGPATIVASTTVKWWDRAVIEEHAARVGAPMRWVSEADVTTVGEELLTWATEVARPPLAKTGASTRASRPPSRL